MSKKFVHFKKEVYYWLPLSFLVVWCDLTSSSPSFYLFSFITEFWRTKKRKRKRNIGGWDPSLVEHSLLLELWICGKGLIWTMYVGLFYLNFYFFNTSLCHPCWVFYIGFQVVPFLTNILKQSGKATTIPPQKVSYGILSTLKL